MTPDARRHPLRIVLYFAVFGVLWILATDLAAERIAATEAELRRIQTFKGWLFVFVSAGFLYWLISAYAESRDRSLQELRRTELRHERAQRIARLGHWELKLPEEELWWSDQVYEIFGVPPEEFGASFETFFSFVHPEDREEMQAAQEAALAGRAALDVEHRIVRRDGQVRHVHERGALEPGREGEPERLVGTVQDITERKELELKLERSRDLLRRYAGHLTSERERERAELAREIHDQLGQLLTAVKLQLERQLRDQEGERREALAESVDLVAESIEEVRDISHELRPAGLDYLGVLEAIAMHADRFEERTGIATSFLTDREALPMDDEESVHLFRVVQEALTNVARHADADHALVEVRSEGDGIVLRVADDGVGLDETSVEEMRSHGMLGMQERALLLGGELEVRNRAAGGTEVVLRVPEGAGPGR